MPRLAKLCQQIASGEELDAQVLGELLSQELLVLRCHANRILGQEYFYKTNDIERAKLYADRAFLFSGVSEDYFNFYIELLNTMGALSEKAHAYKEMGMRYADLGDIANAIKYFNLNRDCFAISGCGDKFKYDFDVIRRVKALAESQRERLKRTIPTRRLGHKIRLAYLVYGIEHSGSVLIKTLMNFAKYHNYSRYDVAFFVPESSHSASTAAQENIRLLLSSSAKVVQPKEADPFLALYESAESMLDFRPHVLITTAALAKYEHYFVASLVSAPTNIGLCFGPPEQYVYPQLDWVATGARHPLIDIPCNTTLIPYASPPPKDFEGTDINGLREEYGIPADAVVLLSAGRPSKFMNRDFWQAVLDILDNHPEAVFVAIGLEPVPEFLSDMIPARLRSRLFLFGWLTDYQRVLRTADIVIDTFPSGGGVTLLDACHYAIPVVTFRQDLSRRFDQMNWSPGEDLIGIPELSVQRFNFDDVKRVISWLITDPISRDNLGKRCCQSARERTGDVAAYVRHHEVLFEDVIKIKTGLELGQGLWPRFKVEAKLERLAWKD